MRIVMMGTGPFAVPTFQALLASEHDVPALVTRPTPPVRGRRKPPPNPMRDVAEQAKLPVFAPDSINDLAAQQTLQDWAADVFVVCDYGQILRKSTLGLARLGGINLHGSLLPKYRGAAPVNWAIYNGDAETGVTVIHMTPKLDGGPALAMSRTPILPTDDAVVLERRLSEMGVAPVFESLAMLADWDGITPLGTQQDPALATAAPRLEKQNGAVDWTRPANAIEQQVRAFKPWPGTYCDWQRSGEPMRLILDEVEVLQASRQVTPLTSPPESSRHPGLTTEQVRSATDRPGEVVYVDKQSLHVATGTSHLSLRRIQPAGKRPMDIAEFLRGYAVAMGDLLTVSEYPNC